MFCTHCGTDNQEEARYCFKCGGLIYLLSRAEPTSPPATLSKGEGGESPPTAAVSGPRLDADTSNPLTERSPSEVPMPPTSGRMILERGVRGVPVTFLIVLLGGVAAKAGQGWLALPFLIAIPFAIASVEWWRDRVAESKRQKVRVKNH